MSELPPVPDRTFVAVEEPARRPVVRRATVRVLVLDPDGQLLLFRDSDPNTGGAWWITPGGGIDPGESEVEAVLRELAEETGLTITPADVIGPLARRRVMHGYSDRIVDQDDTFYAVRTSAFEVSTVGHTQEERVTMLEHRWWTPAQLGSTQETVWPAVLLDLLAVVDEEQAWPVEIPDAEESSVPV